MKYLKIGRYELVAIGVIAFAVGLRILIAALGLPFSNSDEGTMGIMARHIAYTGEHPVMFYGQNYMGSIEAYIAAAFFHLFSPSLLTLRLSVVLLVACFFVTTYLLASLLYSKSLALASLAILSIGSLPYLTRQTIATGGSSQTLLFGSLAYLLAAWLALTYRRGLPLRIKLWRLAGYFVWGLVVGLALWSDMVVLPFVVTAALLLLFCGRELLWACIPLVLGFVIGIYPDYYFSATVLPGTSPLVTLFGLFQGSTTQAPKTLHDILHGISNTLLISLPTATANPFCPVLEITFLGDNTPQTPACNAVHGVWSGGYILLLLIAFALAFVALWQLFAPARLAQESMGSFERRQALVRQVARMVMLLGGGLAIVAYSISSAPMGWPGFHARYLIGLLIITPAVIDPLWRLASMIKPAMTKQQQIGVWGARGVFAVIAAVLLIGTVMALSEVPSNQAVMQRQFDLINNLQRVGVTHMYTDYWTCNNVAFLSNERIICGVVDGNLQPSHNRDPHYWSIISQDPHSALVFPLDSGQLPAARKKAVDAPGKYKKYNFDGYEVYVPLS